MDIFLTKENHYNYGAKPRNSYGSLFKKLKIVPPPYEYIFSLINFITNNLELWQINSTHIHNRLHKTDNHSCLPISLKINLNKIKPINIALKRRLPLLSLGCWYCLTKRYTTRHQFFCLLQIFTLQWHHC